MAFDPAYDYSKFSHLVAGLQAVLARPRVRGAIGLVGGAALVWMGWDMLSSASSVVLDLGSTGQAAYSWPKLLIWGAGVCLANPYFTGWWATVGAGQLAHMAPRTLPEYLAFYLGHEASDYTWYAVVGLVIVTGSNWLTEDINLISIRPKALVFRELVLTKREFEFIRFSSWFLLPLGMALIAGVVWWQRR